MIPLADISNAMADTAPGGGPLVELRGVTKAYPGVVALRAVDMTVRAGEVHAVVGLNGAGKSTLVKVLAGVVRPDSGELVVPTQQSTGGRAVSLVPQDIVMVPELSIGRNVLLGVERSRLVRQRMDRQERDLVEGALARVGLEIAPETMPSACTVPELRLVQIAKALVDPSQVLLLDEPTAVLHESDAEHLLDRVAALREEGEAVVYVSHRLGEVVRVADRITILRDGVKVSELEAGAVDRDQLIEILSKQVDPAESKPAELKMVDDDVVLEVQGLSAPGFDPLNLQVRAGEVIALVGVQDGGQSRVVQSLAGIYPPVTGSARLRGESLDLSSPLAATSQGVVLVPADRRAGGIVGAMDIRENVVLSPRSSTHQRGFRQRADEARTARRYMERFAIKAPSAYSKAAVLSGGNQQKVALAKTMEARPEVFLLDEPTQGIDVATKREVLWRIRDEARRTRRPVVAATSELEEVPGFADTVLVFQQGAVVSMLDGSEATEEALLDAALTKWRSE